MKFLSIRLFANACVAAGAIASFAPTALAGELLLRLVPPGAGASAPEGTKTFTSLQKAVDAAVAVDTTTAERVRIVVSPGIYQGQSAATSGRPGGAPLAIVGDPAGPRPVFDGAGRASTFFTVRNSSGQPTNVTISHLEIRRYLTAINLQGERSSPSASNGGNVITDNAIRDIGDIAKEGAGPSTAAIRLVNSDHNRISNNQFTRIRNNVRCGLMHALYIAHMSTDNEVSNNTFDDGCGVTIKVRDASDRNRITGNKFTNQETEATFGDAFCDEESGKCTKEGVECPSYGNVYTGNTIVKSRNTPKLRPVRIYPIPMPAGCPGQGSRGDKGRVMVKSNTELSR